MTTAGNNKADAGSGEQLIKSRRGFFKLAIATLASLIGVVTGIPRVHSVWAVKRPDGDIAVFSPVCTHLGCYYTWNSERGRFECPCHASVFSIDGTVISGPAPRPLDVLPHKVENGVLYVQWKEFKSGAAGKVEV